MSHADGWHFIQAGAALERSLLLATLMQEFSGDFVEQALSENTDYFEWVGFLRSCVAFEAYLRSSPLGIQPKKIAEFILFDPYFPHSMRFCADQLARSIDALSGASVLQRDARIQRLSGRLGAQLSFADAEDAWQNGLPEFLQVIKSNCFLLHKAIFDNFITYQIDSVLEV
jgi:uncharacterized alpha-E superfamily protein